MKIHEYQAKELMKARGIMVPSGVMVTNVEDAVAAVRGLVAGSGNTVVGVKSQMLARGRGTGATGGWRASAGGVDHDLRPRVE